MLELIGSLLHRIGNGLLDRLELGGLRQGGLRHDRLLARGFLVRRNLARGLLGKGLDAQGHCSGQGSFGLGLGLGKFCLGYSLSLLLSPG